MRRELETNVVKKIIRIKYEAIPSYTHVQLTLSVITFISQLFVELSAPSGIDIISIHGLKTCPPSYKPTEVQPIEFHSEVWNQL